MIIMIYKQIRVVRFGVLKWVYKHTQTNKWVSTHTQCGLLKMGVTTIGSRKNSIFDYKSNITKFVL